MKNLPNTLERVLDKISFEPTSGCGLWTGSLDKDGYPLIKWRGKTTRVTRLVWTLLRGPIPDGLQVLHRCDNPPCANVNHFFLGTDADNHADCVSKGRQARGIKITINRNTARGDRHSSRTHPESVQRGEDSPKAKVRSGQVDEMRRLHSKGARVADLVRMFGMSWSQTNRIVRNQSWVRNGEVTS